MKAAGNTGVTELSPIDGWTKVGGKTRTRRWVGPPSLIAPDTTSGTKAYQLRQAGIDYQIDQQTGQFWTISGTYGVDDGAPTSVPLSDQWYLDVNDLERDIWELPAIVAEFNKTLIDQQKAFAAAQVKRDIQLLVRGEEIKLESGALLTIPAVIAYGVAAGMSGTILWSFVQDLLKGATTFTVDQYVLRRVRVVPENTSIKAINANVGRMISHGTLISSAGEAAPASLPIIGPIPTTGAWLKKKPKAEIVAPGKWAIRQEYWHADDWSRLIYGIAI